ARLPRDRRTPGGRRRRTALANVGPGAIGSSDRRTVPRPVVRSDRGGRRPDVAGARARRGGAETEVTAGAGGHTPSGRGPVSARGPRTESSWPCPPPWPTGSPPTPPA